MLANKKRVTSRPKTLKEVCTAGSIVISDDDISPDALSARKEEKGMLSNLFFYFDLTFILLL